MHIVIKADTSAPKLCLAELYFSHAYILRQRHASDMSPALFTYECMLGTDQVNMYLMLFYT